MERIATAGLVLAAGLSSRFGSAKLLAGLDGRPILQHVLDLATAASLDPVVVVVNDRITHDQSIAWRDELRVTNPQPESGISGSLRLGLAALRASPAQRVLVLLADQPVLDRAQVEAILASVPIAARPFVVPRYGGAPGNPVLLERSAWSLAAGLSEDRGMVQVFADRPELVRYVDLPGANPDVDTPEDLAALSRDA
ncbi:nucleotidyltransferase family protein [soil metagenome]